ncbi:MAG: sugar transferase [Candidatus Kapaibacteriales bacterium]
MLYSILLVCFDLLVFYISFIAAYFIRQSIPESVDFLLPFNIPLDFLMLQIWIPATFLIIFLFNGLYTKKRDYWEDLLYLIKSFFNSVILVFFILTFLKYSGQISRSHLIIAFLIFFILNSAGRYFFKILLNSMNIGVEKILVVGITDSSMSLANLINDDKYIGYKVMGIWDKNYDREKNNFLPINHSLQLITDDSFFEFIKSKNIENIIVSETYSKDTSFLYDLRQRTKNIFLIPESKTFFAYNSFLFSMLYSDSLVLSFKNNLKDPVNKFLKRGFDIIVSLILILLVFGLFSPIMLLLVILIKLDSPGPVFFKQERVGQNGKKIFVFKFRTMFGNSNEIFEKYIADNPDAKAEWEQFHKLKNDPRITRFGRFLRSTSLDELPQLFNVLRGQLSLVGPRPVREGEITRFYKDSAVIYFEIRPGITGLWQISGRNQVQYERRVQFDIMYTFNWSFWLDIVILLKTLKVIITKEGAY